MSEPQPTPQPQPQPSPTPAPVRRRDVTNTLNKFNRR